MKRKHLPKCMYYKHGSYWLVKKNKWHNLGKSYPHAMAEYARIVSSNENDNEVAYLVRITIDEKDGKLAKNTITQYRLCEAKIAKAFQNFRARQVKPRDIMEFMQFHSDTPNMANRMLTVLRMSFDKGILLEMCDSNPTAAIKRLGESKRERLMTKQEFLAIRAYPNPVLGCVMDICYLTAQRISDVLAIKLSDVSSEGIYFKQKKTGTKLLVEMNPALKQAINNAKALHPDYLSPMFLFAQKNGKMRRYSGMKGLFNRGRKLARIHDVTLHDIRAMALTEAKRLNIDATKLAGHANERQTATYLRDKAPLKVVGLPTNVKR